MGGHKLTTNVKHTREGSVRELVIPNAPDSLADIRAFIAAVIADLPLPRRCGLDVVLAAGEAATNCVLHGQSADGLSNTITARVSWTGCRLQVELQDCGPGFRPDLAKWPSPSLTAEEGRGVFIMKALMDDVTYPKVTQGTLCVLAKVYKPGDKRPARRSRN